MYSSYWLRSSHSARFTILTSRRVPEDSSRWRMTILSPPVLVKCDKKHGVPYIAVLTVGIVNIILCMLPFGVIIVLDVSLLVASYILVYISAMVLRKEIPQTNTSSRFRADSDSWRHMHRADLRSDVRFSINGSDYYLSAA